MSKLKPLGKTTAPRPKNPGTRHYNPSLNAQNDNKSFVLHIKKLDPEDRFRHWITERHNVHLKRFGLPLTGPARLKTVGVPKWKDCSQDNGNTKIEKPCKGGLLITEKPGPWTDDPILQTVFFCNPYRENDRVTAYLRDNYREQHKDKDHVLLGTIMLRLFNYIPTMRRLLNANIPQRLVSSPKKALADAAKLLIPLRDNGEQMFGGAYIIRFWPGERKVEALLKVMQSMAEDKKFYKDMLNSDMEYAYQRLTSFHDLGGFYAYQLVGDLAFTHILENASDWHTWGFCGPGTSRGLLRLQGITTLPNGKPLPRLMKKPPGWHDQLEALRSRTNKFLKEVGYPQLHMRDLCNCLCEYDKYDRALFNERNIKRPYAGR